MRICFVMQPFDDGGPFDKRFEDVLAPAIKDAGLDAYRVDRDPSVDIPVEDIERKIRASEVCLADITIDNPNVWFELGFAIASGKDVVLVCSHARTTRFPFDVQHRTIIKYKTDSGRDFEKFRGEVCERLKAVLQKEARIATASTLSLVKPVEGLVPHELVALVAIGENVDSEQSKIAISTIRSDMERAGFTQIATTVALASLVRQNLAEVSSDSDWNGNDYSVYSLTKAGMDWLLANQGLLKMNLDPDERKPAKSAIITDDDIPF